MALPMEPWKNYFGEATKNFPYLEHTHTFQICFQKAVELEQVVSQTCFKRCQLMEKQKCICVYFSCIICY